MLHFKTTKFGEDFANFDTKKWLTSMLRSTWNLDTNIILKNPQRAILQKVESFYLIQRAFFQLLKDPEREFPSNCSSGLAFMKKFLRKPTSHVAIYHFSSIFVDRLPMKATWNAFHFDFYSFNIKRWLSFSTFEIHIDFPKNNFGCDFSKSFASIC